MALLFGPDTHEYWLDGVRLPSTTQILRESGLIRLDGIPAATLERARKRGSDVHAIIHYLNENRINWSSVDPVYEPYVRAWTTYRHERQVKPLLCEFRMASRRHRTAGTLDLLCEIEDDGWLIDFKTGDPEDVAADFQTGSYLGMAFEWATETPKLAAVLGRHQRWRRASVRLMADGRYHTTEYTDPRDYSRFQTLAAAWHIRTERGAVVYEWQIAA